MSARDELIAVMAEAWRESEAGTTTRAMVSVLDAALSSGLCVLVDAEPAGYLIHEHYTDARTPFFVFHALPGNGVEPLYRRALALEVSP